MTIPQSGTEKLIFQPGQVYPVVTGYRYLDELQKRIAPFSDRVLRSECYDLPDKSYQKRYVELSPKQEKMYKELKRQCLTECHGHRMSAALAITKMLRLQQIVGGFYVPDMVANALNPTTDGEEFVEGYLSRSAIPIDTTNPRIEALCEDIKERLTGKVIVWARFVAEIQLIQKRLTEELGPVVRVAYGQQKAEERQEQIKAFQTDDRVRVLIGNPACKGVSRGQNLNSASWEVYYSNSFSLEDRLQSEDRPMSQGVGEVGIIDMIAPDTLDVKVIEALREKKNIADMVTGDNVGVWI